MTGLSSLSPEVIQAISNCVETPYDLKSLRLVSCYINSAVEEELYSQSKLRIDLGRSTLRLFAPLIVDMSTGASRISGLVRNLDIITLDPHLYTAPLIRRPNFKERSTPEPSSEDAEALETFANHFENAIKSLQGLKAVKIQIVDVQAALDKTDRVLRALSHLHIDNIVIDSEKHSDTCVSHLDQLPPMQSIHVTVRNYAGDPLKTIFEPLFQTIVRSSKLRSLSLVLIQRRPRIEGNEPRPSLDGLLENCTELRLDDLLIQGLSADLSGKNIDLFRNAKLIKNAGGFDNDFSPSLPIALRNAGIAAQKIDAELSSTALFKYIGSYRGLRSLTLWIRGDASSDEVMRTFYREVLPLHRDSMEALSLLPEYECGWCLSKVESPAAALAQCLNLVDLSLSVKISDLPVEGIETETEHAGIRSVLNSFQGQPKIRRLTLYSTTWCHQLDLWRWYMVYGWPSHNTNAANQVSLVLDNMIDGTAVDPSHFRPGFRLKVSEQDNCNPSRGRTKCYTVTDLEDGVGYRWSGSSDDTSERHYTTQFFRYYEKHLRGHDYDL